MNTKKQQVIDLWQACFHDDEPFVRLYFEQVYRNENTLVHQVGGRVDSALQMLPYTMAYGGTEIPVSYISGASTYPETRGKGQMKMLLQEAFGKMKQRGHPLSLLIPAEDWLFGFYRKTGYGEGMYYRNRELTPGTAIAAGYSFRCITEEFLQKEATCEWLHRIYLYFSEKLNKRPFCVRHTFADFKIIVSDLFQSKGCIGVLSRAAGEIAGLAFVYPSPEDNRRYVKELLADTLPMQNALLGELAAGYSGSHVQYKETVPAPGIPYGMIRVIDAEKMLALFASSHPAYNGIIALEDTLLPENTGTYILENGRCRKTGETFSGGTRLSMPELATFLFAGQPVYMTLMLD